ncbi:hypothetical protein F1880_002716 [Penicillium rolfsii]|nr:hypothetical protein F1880_002716 [Penicillium rolfsii]
MTDSLFEGLDWTGWKEGTGNLEDSRGREEDGQNKVGCGRCAGDFAIRALDILGLETTPTRLLEGL